MSKLLEKTKTFIKESDPKLFKVLIDNQINDKLIIENAGILLKYLEDKESNIDYKIELEITHKKIQWSYVPKSSKAIKTEALNKVGEYYVNPFSGGENELIIVESKNVDQTKTRQQTLEFAKKLLANYEKKENKGYWLTGNFGVGKTYISLWILNIFAKNGKTISYFMISEVLAKLKSSFGTETNIFSSVVDKYKKVDVLLIDDIGAETLTDWARDEFLFSILNYRLDNKKLTLFTSNMTIKEYSEKILSITKKSPYDRLNRDRLIERIKSLSTEIELKGNNRRNH